MCLIFPILHLVSSSCVLFFRDPTKWTTVLLHSQHIEYRIEQPQTITAEKPNKMEKANPYFESKEEFQRARNRSKQDIKEDISTLLLFGGQKSKLITVCRVQPGHSAPHQHPGEPLKTYSTHPKHVAVADRNDLICGEDPATWTMRFENSKRVLYRLQYLSLQVTQKEDLYVIRKSGSIFGE